MASSVPLIWTQILDFQGVQAEPKSLSFNARTLSVPTRRSDIGFLVEYTMRNDAFLDLKGINNILPPLKIDLEDGLLFRNVLLLNLFLGTWFCSVFGQISAIAREGL